MNLVTLITQMRTRTGLPERGDSGKSRMKTVFNDALRYLWGDIPERFKSEDWRFRTEEVYTVAVSVEPTDPHVLTCPVAANLPTDGTLSGRWIEVYRDSHWIQRRVREVWRGDNTIYIVIDDPWDNLTDTGLEARIWTAEYPYPADVEDVRACVWDPEGASRDLTPSLLKGSMREQRISIGWREQGTPTFFGPGAFMQLPAFHYTPVVGKYGNPDQPGNNEKWGWDDAGVEHDVINPFYGVGGSFSYLEVPVWGRRRWLHPTKLRGGHLAPFYIGPPSLPSPRWSATWGSNAIRIQSPNLDYLLGFGQNTSLPSYSHSGFEKWVFRARHASEAASASNHAHELLVENDDVYYLWKVIDGSVTSYVDRGDLDPIDRHYPLIHHHGHHSIIFDEVPDAATDVMLSVVRRPPEFEWDTDTPRIPPECLDALFYRAAMILVGEMDGDVGRMDRFTKSYNDAVAELTKKAAIPAYQTQGFGDGLVRSRRGSRRLHGSPIST